MKNLLLLISFVVIMLMVNCGRQKNVSLSLKEPVQIKSKDDFTVIRIDSIENVYIVYVNRKDSTFKILSKKVINSDCQTIRVGENLKLNLTSIFLPEEFHVKMRTAGVRFEGVLIPIDEEAVVRDLFLTENLKGLCYLSK